MPLMLFLPTVRASHPKIDYPHNLSLGRAQSCLKACAKLRHNEPSPREPEKHQKHTLVLAKGSVPKSGMILVQHL